MEPSFFFALFLITLSLSMADAAAFTLTNNCAYSVWPGLLSGAGTAPLPITGFLLKPGDSRAVSVPAAWSGRLWARTLCSSDASTGRFACATGDCGSGAVECSGSGSSPPATLIEFTLNGSGGMDFFDVSLVDGYNLPVLVVPQAVAAGRGCGPTGCLIDLNGICPSELRVFSGGGGVACKSACEAFGSPEYCCSGEYGGPGTCKPSAYSQFFKNACPRAYSYAYDDATSTFTCAAGASYLVTFCPSTSSLKSSGSGPGSGSGSGVNPQAAGVPLINDTMVFLGGSGASAAPPSPIPAAQVLAIACFLAARWLI